MIRSRAFGILRNDAKLRNFARVLTKLKSTAAAPSHARPPVDRHVVTSPHSDCFTHSSSVAKRFLEKSSLWPDRIAVECGITGRKHTYGEMQKLIRNFGSSLKRLGFSKGEVLGLVLPNIPEFPVALLGAAAVGMPVTTVNPIYTVEEIARQMENSDATVIVTIPLMAETMRKVAAQCPRVRRLIVVGEAVEGFITMEDMLNDSGDLCVNDWDNVHQDDVFVLPYSSGTTGLPKGVMLTHANIGVNIQQVLHPGTCLLQQTTASYQDVYICVLPFFHCYGLIAVLLTGLDHGAKMITLPRFEAGSYLKTLNEQHPTILQLVPPLVTFLTHTPGLETDSLKSLHTVFCGAAPLGVTAATKLEERLNNPGVWFQEGYGMTELSPVSHMGSLTHPKIGSCGVLVSRTQAKIVDITSGEALGPNQDGELFVKGPQVMKGYYRNEKATNETIDSEGWLHTGDIAHYDEQGRFYIVDRLKELIKVKGMQVAPSELEDLLRKLHGVGDVAVIGIPDEAAGELPRAYVVRRADESGDRLTEKSVHAFVELHVAPHKKLKGGVHFVDSIPKTNTGKILRRELKNQAMQNK